MDIVKMNTAAANAKIAEDFKNFILSDEEWDVEAYKLLYHMDTLSKGGITCYKANAGRLVWKNQQGISLKEFLEKKGYTVSNHFEYQYVEDMFIRYVYSYDTTMKRLERMLNDAKRATNYSEYTMISSIGEIGTSLEYEMMRVISPIERDIAEHQKYLEKKFAEEQEKQRKQKEEFDARMKEREKLRQEMDDNKQQLIFWIATLVVIGVSFLMFN